MRTPHSFSIRSLLTILATLLIWKVTTSAVLEYRNYFPPNFESDFLDGRKPYFCGAYGAAFYLHLFSGPTSLILGTLLVSSRFRNRLPMWHRRIGRAQTVCVLWFVAPSGLWMAYYAATGSVAATGLSLLALATAACVAMGWHAAGKRNWAHHRRWMWRTFILLCSAVVIRLVGGLATVAQFDAPWLYPLTTWASWLVPLLILEVCLSVIQPTERLYSSS